MELVLSPGRLGGAGDKTGSPFENQEVREWSHVDRLTGMLEHARIETGRWQTRHQGTAQAYGKVIDSRERNSADGNVVQKARRQVEVFQSQGIGGRSVQVVRASQWSSSRITDSTSSSPVTVSMNDAAQLRNGNDESLAKLSQVSRLCRQINGEAAVSGNKRSPVILPSKMLNSSPLLGNRFRNFDGPTRDEGRDKIGSSLTTSCTLKSTSSEDLTKSIDSNAKSQAIFTRDCKARRSLQIQKSAVTDMDGSRNGEERTCAIINGEDTDSGSSASSDREISSIKSDRKRVKSYVLGTEEPVSEAPGSSGSLPKPMTDRTYLFNGARGPSAEENTTKSEYLRPTPILLKPIGSKPAQSIVPVTKSNKTVVHLNNRLFLDSQKTAVAPSDRLELRSAENLSDGIVHSRVQSLASRFSNSGKSFSSINGKLESSSTTSSSRIENLISRSTAISTGSENLFEMVSAAVEETGTVINPGFGKPVKKVGFCKTEVHFAAESGKVNIVETDFKPPPSNRFRRRRRNSIAMNVPIALQNKNLPLIHFGDTSYEKYIFGQSNNANNSNNTGPNIEGDFKTKDKSIKELLSQTERDSGQKDLNDVQKSLNSDEFNTRDGLWGARIKNILQSEPATIINDDDDVNQPENLEDTLDETIVDHTFKGSHTTTVNLGANVVSKIQKHTNEGKCNTISTGIQLQFNTRIERLIPAVNKTLDIRPCVDGDRNVSTKSIVADEKSPAPFSIVVSTVSKIPRPLIQSHQSVLKSAHLVMNLNRINSLNSMMKSKGEDDPYSSNCEKRDDPFALKRLLISSLRENCSGMVNRPRDHADVDIVNNNYSKSASTLITVNSNSASTINYKNRIANSNAYPARFTPLQLKTFNDRLNEFEEPKRVDDQNDAKENQLQYSSGSEQADEEVRSYMLGSNIHHSYNQHKKFSHSRSVNVEKCTTIVHKSHEDLSASSTVKETRDNDQSIDTLEENVILDDDLDIINSDVPVEEICFEANRTLEKNSVTDIAMNESNVVTSDNENNKVLLNIVTTHEPVIARVEESHSPDARRELFVSKKLRSNSTTQVLEDKTRIVRETSRSNKPFSLSAKKAGVKNCKAKDLCDNKTGKDVSMSVCNGDTKETDDPTYVNVFESGKKSTPIYENCRVTRKNNINNNKFEKGVNTSNAIQSLAEMNAVANTAVKSTNGNCEMETSLLNTDCEDENFKQYSKSRNSDAKLATISESNLSKRNNRDSQKVKPSKTRSKKSVVRSPSSTSSIESMHRSSANETSKDSEAKPLHTKSTRSSRLHCHETAAGDTIERYSSNDKKKNTSERISNSKVPRSNHSTDTSTVTKNNEGRNNLNDSTRSKKPIEIVYQTAVFNMKNEKLAKSSKSKESKTPRYINDLICGSRPKRSTDVRHVKGSALSQQRVHHKSASPTNRHWK